MTALIAPINIAAQQVRTSRNPPFENRYRWSGGRKKDSASCFRDEPETTMGWPSVEVASSTAACRRAAANRYTASFFSQITAPVNTIATKSRLESEVITCPAVPKRSPV
jgi:hypothetical protein